MATAVSILKNLADIKSNHTVLEDYELIEETVIQGTVPTSRKTLLLHVRPYIAKSCLCPVCGKKCPCYDAEHSLESHWRAANLNGIPVYLCYRPNRIRCPEDGVLTEKLPWTDGNSRFTVSFNNEVAWLVGQLSRTKIALFEKINWRTVGNCIKAAQNRLEPDLSARMRNLRRICVDETSYKKGYAYITVVYDMDRNQVAWIHEGCGLEVFQKFCNALTAEERQKIEIVAGDGAKWIDICTADYFPNAVRCIDFFHVCEWATDMVDKVRTETAHKARQEYNRQVQVFQEEEAKNAKNQKLKQIDAELATMAKRGRPNQRKKQLLERRKLLLKDVPKKTGRKKKENLSQNHQEEVDRLAQLAKNIKESRFALWHNPENCTAFQHEKLQLIANSFPDLYKAYQFKESLRLILHMSEATLAAAELKNWIAEAGDSQIQPLIELSEKIKRHYQSIVYSIQYKANSAKSEAVNTSIKLLIRMARGFRNIDNMIALIYLKCSELIIPLNNRCPSTTQKQITVPA